MEATEETCVEIPDEKLSSEESKDIDAVSGHSDRSESSPLYRHMRPLIILLKICGFYYPRAKNEHCKIFLSVFFSAVIWILNVFIIVNKVIALVSSPFSITMKTLAFTLVGFVFHVQSIVNYINPVRTSVYFSKFLADLERLEGNSKDRGTARIVYAVVGFFMSALLAIMLSSIISVYQFAQKMFAVFALSLKSIDFVANLLTNYHGLLAGFVRLQQYLITSMLLIRETRRWNKEFTKSIAQDGTYTGSIEAARLEFERIVNLVAQADVFLSPYVVAIAVTTVPLSCFLVYVLIIGAIQASDMSRMLITLIYAFPALGIVIIVGTILNITVSNKIVQYRYLIPAPVDRTSANARLYTQHLVSCQKNEPSTSMTRVACESKLRSILKSAMHPCPG